jgi:hypothetical protein
LAEGNDSPIEDEDIPISYTLYRWRKAMGVDYISMLDTPIQTILEDLEYIDIENQINKPKEQPTE